MLIQVGRRPAATYYAVGSIVAGVLCVIGGMAFGGLFA
jgi:hypothetical protein